MVAIGDLMMKTEETNLSYLKQLEKHGISAETIAAALELDISLLIDDGNMFPPCPEGWSHDKYTQDMMIPISRLAYAAQSVKHGSAALAAHARGLIKDLTNPSSRGVSMPQLTIGTVAKYGDVPLEAAERFYVHDMDCLTDAEIARLIIALSIIDRELNYKPRRRYFSGASNMNVE